MNRVVIRFIYKSLVINNYWINKASFCLEMIRANNKSYYGNVEKLYFKEDFYYAGS